MTSSGGPLNSSSPIKIGVDGTAIRLNVCDESVSDHKGWTIVTWKRNKMSEITEQLIIATRRYEVIIETAINDNDIMKVRNKMFEITQTTHYRDASDGSNCS